MNLIAKLQHQSTWKLLFLGLITYGVYYAFYLDRQTKILNSELEEGQRVSGGFIKAFYVISYVSVALFVLYLCVDTGHPIESASNAMDMVWSIMLIIWGFQVRNRINSVCGFSNKSDDWFHGLWTFLFSPLYFNYKLNVLNEKAKQIDSGVDETSDNE